MKRILFVAATLLIFNASANAQQSAKAHILTSEIFSDSLQTHAKALLLDVRTAEEFDEGHLKNALNIDFNKTDFKAQVNALDKSKTYYVYCRSGKRSAAAVEQLRGLGFKKIYELEGGILKWVADGMQTVKEVSAK